MFRWDVIWQNLFSSFIFQAAWTTLWISVVAELFGVIIGLFLALMRMSRFRILSMPAGAYIWFFRGSPLLVQVLLLWDGLPKLAPSLLLPGWAVVVVAFSLNEGAYMAEITRAGITSVDPGQMEAAKSLGMRYALAMRRIILPQAARVIIPPLGNEFNNMLKTTSIASVIGLQELTGTAEIFGASNFTIFEWLILATFFYLFLTTVWGYIQSWIENRLNPDRITKLEIQEKKSWTQRMIGFGTRTSDSVLAGARTRERR